MKTIQESSILSFNVAQDFIEFDVQEFFIMLFRFLYLLYWDLIISIFVRWLNFKLLHFLRLGMKVFFTLSFGFLEVLISKFWVHVLQYMKEQSLATKLVVALGYKLTQ